MRFPSCASLPWTCLLVVSCRRDHPEETGRSRALNLAYNSPAVIRPSNEDITADDLAAEMKVVTEPQEHEAFIIWNFPSAGA